MGTLQEMYGDTALVTGASSGFGREFARELAKEGFKNIAVVARREDRLRALAEELKEKHGTHVLVIRQDLREPAAVTTVMQKMHQAGLDVDLLVNNVGVGTYGWFGKIDIGKELAMVDVNSKVGVELTYYCLPHMKKRGRGGIINVAGLMDEVKAGTFSAYCGTKAFVSAFSECLNEELRGTGIDVVCLSPGYNPDTEIFLAAGVNANFPFPRGNPTAVARYGLKILKRRKVKAVHGFLNNVIVTSTKFTPRRMRQFMNRKLVGDPEKRLVAN